MSNSSTWKDKILDYEIETFQTQSNNRSFSVLEKIRFSITRLKLQQSSINEGAPFNLKR